MPDLVPGADEPPDEDLEELYERAPCGYLSVRPNGRIFKGNATIASCLGFGPGELVGRRLHDLLTVAGRIFYETHFAPLLRLQGFFNEVALDLVAHDGTRLPVLVNAAERRAPDGRHQWTRRTVFNATERRRYERELLAARSAADAARKEVEQLHSTAQAHLLDERSTAALREEFIASSGMTCATRWRRSTAACTSCSKLPSTTGRPLWSAWSGTASGGWLGLSTKSWISPVGALAAA